MDGETTKIIKEIIRENLEDFEWNILGIVDTEKNVYPMTTDTKVLSKVFEMKIIPHFKEIIEKLSVEDKQCELILAKAQNQYPDITLTGGIIGEDKIAIDIKSAYRKDANKFSGFTLGAFNGYFKNRNSTNSIRYPYNQYSKHWILCFLYDRDTDTDITEVCSLEECNIPNMITNVELILQEKWKVAKAGPGSGNTANIGSINNIEDLRRGRGVFSLEGEDIFNDYWMHYIRKEDCNKIGFKEQPFKNLESYKIWHRTGRPGAEAIEHYYKIENTLPKTHQDGIQEW